MFDIYVIHQFQRNRNENKNSVIICICIYTQVVVVVAAVAGFEFVVDVTAKFVFEDLKLFDLKLVLKLFDLGSGNI